MKVLSESYGYISESQLGYNRAKDFDSIFDKVNRYSLVKAKHNKLNEGTFYGNIMFTINESDAVKDMFAIYQANVLKHLYETYVKGHIDCDFKTYQQAINEFGWNDIKNAASKAKNFVTDKASKVADKTRELATNVKDKAVTTFNNAKDKLKSLAEKIWMLIPEKIRKALMMIVELAKKVITNVKDFINALEEMLMSFGSNIREALYNMGGFGKEINADMSKAEQQEKLMLGESALASSIIYRQLFEKEESKDKKNTEKKGFPTFDLNQFDNEFFNAGTKYEGEAEMYNIVNLSLMATVSKGLKLEENANFDLGKALLEDGVMASIKDKIDKSGVTAKAVSFLDWASNSKNEKPTIELIINKLAKPITNSEWFQSFYDSDVWKTGVGKKVASVLGIFKKILVSTVNSVIYTKALPLLLDGFKAVITAGVSAGAIASGIGVPIALALGTAKIVLKWGWITKNVWALYRRQKDAVKHNGGGFWTFGFVFQLLITVGIPILNAFNLPIEKLLSSVMANGEAPLKADASIIDKMTHAAVGAVGTVFNWIFTVISKLFEWTGLKALSDCVVAFFARVLNYLGHALGNATNIPLEDVNEALGKTFAVYGLDYQEFAKGHAGWLAGHNIEDQKGENDQYAEQMKKMKNGTTKELQRITDEATKGALEQLKQIGTGGYINMRVPGEGGNSYAMSKEFLSTGTQETAFDKEAIAEVKKQLGQDISIFHVHTEEAVRKGAMVFRDAAGKVLDIHQSEEIGKVLKKFFIEKGYEVVDSGAFKGTTLTKFIPTVFNINDFKVDWSWWSGLFKRDKSIRFQYAGQEKKREQFKVVGFSELSYKEVVNLKYKTTAVENLLNLEKDNIAYMIEHSQAYATELKQKQAKSGISKEEKELIDAYINHLEDAQKIETHRFFVIDLKIDGNVVPGVIFSYASMCGADAYQFTKELIEDNYNLKDMIRETPYYIKGLFSHIYMKPLEDNDDDARDDIASAIYDLMKGCIYNLENWGNLGIQYDEKNNKYKLDENMTQASANMPNALRGNFSLAELCDIMNAIISKDKEGVFKYFMTNEGMGAVVDNNGNIVTKVINDKVLEKYKDFVKEEVIPFFEDTNSKIARYYLRHNMNIYKLLYGKDDKFRLEKVFLTDPLYIASFTRPMYAGSHGTDETDYTTMETLFASKTWSKCVLSKSDISDTDKKKFYMLAKRVSEKFWELYDIDWSKLRQEHNIQDEDDDDIDYDKENDWGRDPEPVSKPKPTESDDDDIDYDKENDWGRDLVSAKDKDKDVKQTNNVNKSKERKEKTIKASQCKTMKDIKKWFSQQFVSRMNNTNKTLYKKFIKDRFLKDTNWLVATDKPVTKGKETYYQVDASNLMNEKLLMVFLRKIATIKSLSKRSILKSDDYWEHQVFADLQKLSKKKLDPKEIKAKVKLYRRFYNIISEYTLGDKKMDNKQWSKMLKENKSRMTYAERMKAMNENFIPSYLVSDNDLKFLIEDNEYNIGKMFELTTSLRKMGVTAKDIISDSRTKRLCEYNNITEYSLMKKLSKYLY